MTGRPRPLEVLGLVLILAGLVVQAYAGEDLSYQLLAVVIALAGGRLILRQSEVVS